MYKKLPPAFILSLFTLILSGQVKTNFNNTSKLSNNSKFNKTYSNIPYQMGTPNLSRAYAREKIAENDGSKIFYIAEPVSMNIDVSKFAGWADSGKSSFAKFTLKAKGAKTLSINFSDFFLPEGTEMFIYNENAEMITGVITETENNEARMWGSSIYKGDEVNIEFKVPTEIKEKISLQISNVAYGYKDIFIDKLAGFGQSGACNINVLCPQGNAWVAERNSVVYIARSNGDALCSGSMLMNTCATNIPYLLTANHCFIGDGNVTGWRVHFQAWSATCAPNQNSDGILFNGSTLRANWDQSDFCLVQLNQTPPANSGIQYAGWSKATAAATSGAGIHHPSGDVMKISIYNAPLQRLDNTPWVINGQNVFAPGTLHWRVQWPTNNGLPNGLPISGVTEGGSSGSPLFDQNHRVVGQLSGGPSACVTANNKQDHYGRFDNSWTGGGTNTTRLSNWLDPSGTNVVTTNTTDISALANSNLTISGNANLCIAETYFVNTTVPITWGSTPPGYVNFSCTTCSTTTATRVTGVRGNITITATLATGCGASKAVSVGSPVAIGYTKSSTCTNGFQTWNPSVTPSSNGSNWVWTLGNVTTGSVINIYNPNSTSPQVNVKGYGAIKVNYTDLCGTAQQDGLTVFSSCPPSLVVSPNPASDNATISLTDASVDQKSLRSASLYSKKIYKINVVNKLGSVVKVFNYRTGINSVNINLAGLLNGTYTIQAFDGSKWSSNQLVILR